MNIRLPGLLCCLFLVSAAYGQQDPTFSQKMLNLFSINPGAAGSVEAIATQLAYRNQWPGIEGAPKTLNATIHAPVSLWGIPSGVGLSIQQDEFAFDNDMSVAASYAYHLEWGGGILGMGLSLGMLSKNLRPEWFIPNAEGYTAPGNDPDIPAGDQSSIVADLGMGLYYHTPSWYIGLSATHLNSPSIDLTKSAVESTQVSTANYKIKTNLYFQAGTLLPLNNPKWELAPALLVHSDLAVTQYYANLRALYNKTVWGGVSYRTEDAIVVMGGFDLISGLSFSYSYDITTSKIAKYGGGAHEIMVGYRFMFKQERDSQKYKSVRFL